MTKVARSRAMAVAAHEERLYVYALKSMDEMRTEFKEKARLEPIKEVRLLLFSIMRTWLITASSGKVYCP